jgi:DNA (cytosine-5)-methyltransferase 1
MTLTIGSLFSGIGGLELGLERAGLGPVVWQCECDPDALRVLAHHWPCATRYNDVRQLDCATLPRVDIICGGFPCQDISSAGKRAGLRGARSGLWAEFRRIVAAMRPQWVVVENVAGNAIAWIDPVSLQLAQLGYSTLPVPLAAADVGAPHRRRRVFIVAAHADAQGESAQPEHAKMASASTAADAERSPLRQQSRRQGRPHRASATVAAHAGWQRAQPDMVRMVHGLSAQLDAHAGPRIRALGNAVVPQCAEVIGHVIQELRRR